MKDIHVVLTALVAGIVLVACDDGDVGPSSPTESIALTRTPTPTETPAITDSPTSTESAITLFNALASPDEVPVTRQLRNRTMIYAYKQGGRVTVMRRDLASGTEQQILEYDEAHEAEHNVNYWSELVPSIAADPTGSFLIYVAETEVVRHDLVSGASTTLLTPKPNPSGDAFRSAWLTPSGQQLCCAYALASPSIGPAGRFMALMAQYEGSTMASVATDGSDACEINLPGSSFFGFSGRPAWSQHGDLGTASWGAYDTSGAFVTPADTPCTASAIAEGIGSQGIGYEGAAWSPDGNLLAAAKLAEYGGDTPRALVAIEADGSSQDTIIAEGRNYEPLFSQDGQAIYFLRAEDVEPYIQPEAEHSLWVYSLQSNSVRDLVSLPPGWWTEPDGWTEEGYLILRTHHGCPSFHSCRNRVAIIDPIDGSLLYLSAERDFTNYLGFLP